ncbi:MAG: hypothetical protein ABI700_14980 [Chloroflexota bacterium]
MGLPLDTYKGHFDDVATEQSILTLTDTFQTSFLALVDLYEQRGGEAHITVRDDGIAPYEDPQIEGIFHLDGHVIFILDAARLERA